jgi:hypothetical protein
MHHSSDLIEMGDGKHGFNGRVGGNAQETPDRPGDGDDPRSSGVVPGAASSCQAGHFHLVLGAAGERGFALSANALYPYPTFI